MAIKAVLSTGNNIRVLERSTTSSGSILGLYDVDNSATLVDGSVLIYDGVAKKFIATTTIKAPNAGLLYIDGGDF